MSELDFPNTHLSSLFISHLVLFCSIILSHPLYLSYLIYFSPYLLKLLSFLSPLLITTFLLSLARLTGLSHDNFSARIDDDNEEIFCLEDLEAYAIVFGTSMIEVGGISDDVLEERSQLKSLEASQAAVLKCSTIEDSSCVEMEEKRLQDPLEVLDEFDSMICDEQEKVEEQSSTKIDKVVEKQKEELLVRSGSEAADNIIISATVSVFSDSEKELKVESSSTSSHNLGTHGSMRKEKEWKRTLACKLFEERHNVDGMDSLWETYDTEATAMTPKGDVKMKKTNKKEKKSEIELYDDREEIDGQLCCLQALNFSAAKMNMGVGRPNLVKISKAIKGIGWLHRVSRQGKKVHNNGDR